MVAGLAAATRSSSAPILPPALYFLPPNFVLTEDRREADFFVALTLSGCDKTSDGKTIAEVSRFGAASGGGKGS